VVKAKLRQLRQERDNGSRPARPKHDKNKIGTDVAYQEGHRDELPGSERSTQQAVAEVQDAWRLGGGTSVDPGADVAAG